MAERCFLPYDPAPPESEKSFVLANVFREESTDEEAGI